MPSEVFVVSAEKYQFWAIDHVNRQITIVPREGETLTEPIDDESIADLPDIAHSIFDWDKWWITTFTRRGHTIFSMGFNPESTIQGPHRPTIYLDQNKWSELATAVLVPERIRTDKQLSAALEIIRFAGDDGTILPLSSAHLLETSWLHGDRRYEVGVTIASFSGGWQMRHPWNVFEQEAIEALASRLNHAMTIETGQPVITTEPNAWTQRTSSLGLGPRPEGGVELFFSMLTAPGVIVQELIDPQAEQRTPLTTWVDTHERITRQFRTLKASKDQKRALARRRFWNENIGIYRQAAAKVFRTVDFPTFSDRELRTLLAEGPMTSLISELFMTRFIDQTTKWTANDLVDMFYLSCAAGYCDYVVGEVKTATHLQQIQRRQGKKVNVYSDLHSLVEALHADGVTTDTERRNLPSDV
ncbi:hypothetical protein H4N58_14115 [Mumia sp. ZJ1417]|uniref:hypothetical protein n=1 Tax=Mumia sp. ZJ1417 TaxID=2708082 RepID=UPI00141F7DD1|nr:hypothetical protein [Mumia sp. ZJ1417]QMW65331.1 hypothetical protein H4N58_14115 [Mumia sp. ZJ1417]